MTRPIFFGLSLQGLRPSGMGAFGDGGGSKGAPTSSGIAASGLAAKFYEHIGHDHLWEEGAKSQFPRRLLACWYGLPTKAGVFSKLTSAPPFPFGFRDYPPRLQGCHNGSQIDAGNSS